jgi:3-oxoacyl-[acyl-carrier protein] reductase
MRRDGMGAPDDVAPMIVYLASDAAGDITGQCVAAGGDRISLWAHPVEVVTAFRDGGWTAEAIAEVFPSIFRPQLQDFRPVPVPEPPAVEPRESGPSAAQAGAGAEAR